MAFGVPARHHQRERYRRTSDELQRLARDAVGDLKWTVLRDEPGLIEVRVRINFWSWGELVAIQLGDGFVDVLSRCRAPSQCIDWGRNERNVEAFFARMPSPELPLLDAAHAASGLPVGASAITSSSSNSRP
jgi:hypothetical protein